MTRLDPNVSRSEPKTFLHIKRIADSGFKGFSCGLLGEVYLEGELVERSERKAKKYFKLGCKAEDEDSCRELKKL
jgi:TPR repeat protein